MPINDHPKTSVGINQPASKRARQSRSYVDARLEELISKRSQRLKEQYISLATNGKSVDGDVSQIFCEALVEALRKKKKEEETDEAIGDTPRENAGSTVLERGKLAKEATHQICENRPDWNAEIVFQLLFTEVLAMAQEDLEQEITERKSNSRIASVMAGLNTEYLENPSVGLLLKEIHSLFSWYENNNFDRRYMSPSLAFVQSSGMGKTRTLKEIKMHVLAKEGIAVKMALCHDGSYRSYENGNQPFDHLIEISSAMIRKPYYEQKKLLLDRLNSILYDDDVSEDKVVLLIDEAQLLTQGKGYLYRVTRWWLREVRSKKVVVVFTGTSPSLATSMDDGSPDVGDTRNTIVAYRNYENNSKKTPPCRLYAPFCWMASSGIMRKKVQREL